MDEFDKILDGMEPDEAARTIAAAAGKVFPLIGEEERRLVITEMLGDTEGDKVAGLVHL
jgi:hypothetical protein